MRLYCSTDIDIPGMIYRARSGFQSIPSCSCSLDGIFAGLTKEGLSVTSGNGAVGAPNLARVSAARRSETVQPSGLAGGPGKGCKHIGCGCATGRQVSVLHQPYPDLCDRV
jgi:hypothetical protein